LILKRKGFKKKWPEIFISYIGVLYLYPDAGSRPGIVIEAHKCNRGYGIVIETLLSLLLGIRSYPVTFCLPDPEPGRPGM
jgi:hypothetical protein